MKKHRLVLCLAAILALALILTACAKGPSPQVGGQKAVDIEYKSYEGAFLAGYAAAKTSKTGKIGFLGGKEDRVSHDLEYAYRFGALEANPQIKMIVDYVGSDSDKAKGQDFATAQYIEGADVIFAAAGASDLGVFEAAKVKDKWVIGFETDQTTLALNNGNIPQDLEKELAGIKTKMADGVYRFETTAAQLVFIKNDNP